MTTYSNDFSGGTNGVAITAANSGGASGDAFNTVTQGDGVLFDNTHVYNVMGCKIVSGTQISCDIWQPAAGAFTNGTFWAMIYVATGASIPANFTIAGFYSGSTVRVRVSISTTLKVVINSSAGGTATSTNSLPTGQMCLVEASGVFAAGTGGSLTVNIYSTPTSSTPLETFGQTGVNYGGTADRIRLGKGTAPASAAPDFWFGMLKANDTGATFGPVPSTTPANVAPPAGAATAAATVPVVSGAATVAPPAGAATGAATSPVVTAAASISPPAGVATGSATSPTISAGVSTAPPAGAAVAAATSPGVTAGAFVAPPAAAAVGAATSPAISYGVTVSPPAGASTGTVTSPAVSAAVTVTIPSSAATGSATPPVITVVVTLAVPAGVATATATSPAIGLAATVLAPPGVATAAATAPLVTYLTFRDLTLTAVALEDRWTSTALTYRQYATTGLADRWASTALADRWTSTPLPDRFAAVQED